MNKIVLGVVAGITAGYFLRKIQEKASFKEMCDSINGFSFRTRKKMKEAIDRGTDEANCIKDQIESKINI